MEFVTEDDVTRVCLNKHMSVATKHIFCHDKSILVATKLCLCLL